MGWIKNLRKKAGIGIAAGLMGMCLNFAKADEKTVMFQLDDIQSFWLEDTTRRLVNIHIREGVPVTLGVCGEGIAEGGIAKDLKKWNIFNKRYVEIAEHTYSHRSYEDLGFREQVDDIKKGKKELGKLGIKPRAFIPAYDWGNKYTMPAILYSGFQFGFSALDNPLLDHIRVLERGAMYSSNFSNFSEMLPVIEASGDDYFIIGYHLKDFESATDEDFEKFSEFLREVKKNYRTRTASQYFYFR